MSLSLTRTHTPIAVSLLPGEEIPGCVDARCSLHCDGPHKPSLAPPSQTTLR